MEKTTTLNLRINPTVKVFADSMSDEEILEKLQRGYDGIQAGRTQNAASAFAKFRKNHEA